MNIAHLTSLAFDESGPITSSTSREQFLHLRFIFCSDLRSPKVRIIGPERAPEHVRVPGDAVPTQTPSITLTQENFFRWHSRRIVSVLFDASGINGTQSVHPGTGERGYLRPLELPSIPNGMERLCNLEVQTNWKVSFHSLLGILGRTPALQTLYVSNLNRHQLVLDESRAGTMPTVRLPLLTHVILCGYLSRTVDDFLSKLILPSNACVRVSFPHPRSAVIAPLRTMLSAAEHVCITYAMTPGIDHKRYTFELSDVDKRIQALWEWTQPADTADDLHYDWLGSGALSNVRSLTVSLSNVGMTFYKWLSLIEPFPCVRHLSVHDMDPPRKNCRHTSFEVREGTLTRSRRWHRVALAVGLFEFLEDPSGYRYSYPSEDSIPAGIFNPLFGRDDTRSLQQKRRDCYDAWRANVNREWTEQHWYQHMDTSDSRR